MAEIHKIPKRSRLNQQPPPLWYEPVDEQLLARLDLPRYQPPKRAGRSRTRQRAQPQPQPEPPVAQKSAPQDKPTPKPALPSTQRPSGAQPEKQTPSPYTKRPPFNSALPPRRAADPARPASDRQPPAGAPTIPPKPPLNGNQPTPGSIPGSIPGMRTNLSGISGARNLGRPAVPGSRPPGSQPPGRNQPLPENRPEPEDRPKAGNQPPVRPPSQPSSDPRRPFGSSRPAGSRPMGSRPTGSRPDSEPAQQRPFRLPPLDFSMPDASDPVDRQTEERTEAAPEHRPEVRPEVRPENRQEPLPDPGFQFWEETPSLRDVLLNTEGLPAHTAILGVCEDQLPVLLDLNDPAPGSVLVISDERQQELDLLRVAIISVALRNTARGAQFIVFSHLPEVWNQWVDEQSLRRYCLGVVGAETNQAREWIYRLSEWAEQRASDQREGPPVLVLFDTLSFMTRLSGDARQRLESIIRDGPQVRVWSMAAVSTALASSLSHQLDAFDTRLWGYSEDPGFYTRLAGLSAAEARTFGAPGQFAVRVGPPGDQTWLKFRLPTLDGLLP